VVGLNTPPGSAKLDTIFAPEKPKSLEKYTYKLRTIYPPAYMYRDIKKKYLIRKKRRFS